MTRWTREAVSRAAPDATSYAAARRLAAPGPWSDTGSTDTLVWGKCQGSGGAPYQVSVDLDAPAYRCSCASRKHPCKHALALLLLWVDGDGSVGHAERPADFAEQRVRRAAAAASAAPRKEVDEEARAKRVAARLELMSGGIEDLALWLADLVREGVASVRQRPWSWWDGTAGRLVDAQLPGLAEQVRALGSDVNRRDDWVEHLLLTLGRLWAVTQAWAGRDHLDDDQWGDLRAVLGWPYATQDVRAADGLDDAWLVLGTHRTDDGRLQQQRTWLWGETSHELVQVLDFAAGGSALPVRRVLGSVLEARVARYPGHAPRRALLVEDPVPAGRRAALPRPGAVGDAHARHAEVAAANPWVLRVPVTVAGARILADRAGARLVDEAGDVLPLATDTSPWAVLARSGGAPVDVFGELEGGHLRLLSAVVADASGRPELVTS